MSHDNIVDKVVTLNENFFFQIPCFETRSDGRDNFVGALILAGNYNIPEVCVYFRHQLMRGNRIVVPS